MLTRVVLKSEGFAVGDWVKGDYLGFDNDTNWYEVTNLESGGHLTRLYLRRI